MAGASSLRHASQVTSAAAARTTAASTSSRGVRLFRAGGLDGFHGAGSGVPHAAPVAGGSHWVVSAGAAAGGAPGGRPRGLAGGGRAASARGVGGGRGRGGARGRGRAEPEAATAAPRRPGECPTPARRAA